MTQMTVSVDKDMKAITITVFHIFKKPEEFVKWKHGRYTNHPNQFSRDKNHSVWDEKNIWNEINHRLDIVEEKTNKFEDTAVETTQNDIQRKKTKKNRISVITGTISNGQPYMSLQCPW